MKRGVEVCEQDREKAKEKESGHVGGGGGREGGYRMVL
jgi:hypothetical protein